MNKKIKVGDMVKFTNSAGITAKTDYKVVDVKGNTIFIFISEIHPRFAVWEGALGKI